MCQFETNAMKYLRFFSPALLTKIIYAAAPAQAQTEPDSSADDIISTGLTTLKMLDENRVEELWPNVSAFVKTRKPKDVFLQELRSARATVGAVQKREWAGVIRVLYQEGSITPPPGLYANLDISTTLKDGRTVFEKVSFRLEPSGWQLTGYEPRQAQ